MSDSMDARTLKRVNSCLNKIENERLNSSRSISRLRDLVKDLDNVWPDERSKRLRAHVETIAELLKEFP